jgi:dTDP-4-amino-4,6-dideoxygalactose transaminase
MTALPALLGGPPVRPQGPPSWPPSDDDIRAALEGAVVDGSWGRYHGGHVEQLEHALAAYHEVPFALTCASGTFAVELALRALQVGAGDEVIMAAYDYPGNFLSVHAVGAQPVLVDVAPHHWNMSVAAAAAALGPATRAVIASHLHGGTVLMAELMDVVAGKGVAVVEDAAQATGALVQGRRAGTWGDVGVLSFGGSKLLTAGRGGAMLTRRPDVHQRARLWQNRGNVVCPLSELQAAVLLPQLAKLDERHRARATGVTHLQECLRDVPGLRSLGRSDNADSPAYYKLGFQYNAKEFGVDRTLLVAALRAEGVALDEGFRALHLGRSPRRFRRGSDLKEAECADRGMLILHHPVLLGPAAAFDEVARALRKVHTHAAALSAHANQTFGSKP